MPDETAVQVLPPAIEIDRPLVDNSANECRTLSVAKSLDAAYMLASTLELTDDEIARLRADFDDECVTTGADGKQTLLYIAHAFVRERFHAVFRPGQWSLICRRMWPEDYVTAKGDPAVRIYAECVLLVRGCYVGEAIGAMSYYPSNAAQNYSDAVEGAKSEALRRIAGKDLGVGLQVWKKAWCEGWFQRHRAGTPRNPIHDRESPPETLSDPECDQIFKVLVDRRGVDGTLPDEDMDKFLALASTACKGTVTHLSQIPQHYFGRVLDMAKRISARKKEDAK